jgi:hypothetical protein
MLVSRPDACLRKARIAIQIYRSGRQSALVRTRVQLIWKFPIRLQPSGRLLFMVRTREALYGHATVRTSVSHRPDAALKHERFSAKFLENPVAQLSVRTAQVHRLDGICTYYSSRPFCTSAYK